MGFFDFLKPRSKVNVQEYWPGGKILQVHFEYNENNQNFTYIGRYGLRFIVPVSSVAEVTTKEVSRSHGVIQFFDHNQQCVGTSDMMPLEACEQSKVWLDAFFSGNPSLQSQRLGI